MPELPEVETTRRYVEAKAARSMVLRTDTLDPRMLDPESPTDLDDRLRGRTILGTGRHGKNLFLHFEDGTLHIHLGMSGSILFCEGPDHHSSHERLRLNLDRGVLMLDDPRRFGRFGWFPDLTGFVAVKGLGPDALTITKKEFVGRMTNKKSAIKAVLLDQHVLAGLGNLYVDEVLFQRGIDPRTPASLVTLGALEDLWRTIGKVLNASIDVETDFKRLPPEYLLQCRERRGACPRCGQELASTVVGGRTTIFCPLCQR